MKKTVVIVDDLTNELDILKEIIQINYDVKLARSSFEAINVLKSTNADILVTNSRFKTSSITEMLSIIRNSKGRYSNIPIVILAADISPDLISSARTFNIAEIVKKPFEPLTLLKRLSNAVLKSDPNTFKFCPITGCLKKEFAETEIEEFLSENEDNDYGAMMVVDLDNFAFTSNNVKKETFIKSAEILKSRYGEDSVVAVSGKSSFVVFLKRELQRAEIQAEGDWVVSSLLENVTNEKLYVSIGLASVARHGRSFEDLYLTCDRGLGVVRQKGKNAAAFYNW